MSLLSTLLIKERLTNSIFLRRSNIICLVSGIFAGASMPPWDLWWAFIIGFSGFFFIMHTKSLSHPAIHSTQFFPKIKASLKSSFCAWLFYFGFFMTSCHWIVSSLRFELDKFWWLIPFTFLLIPAYLALFPWAAAALCLTHTHHPFARILFYSALAPIVEILKSNFFYGFPWNLLGMNFHHSAYLSQSASIFGVRGLSLFASFLALVPAILLISPPHNEHGRSRTNYKICAVVAAGVIILSMSLLGFSRLKNAPPIDQSLYYISLISKDKSHSKITKEISSAKIIRLVHPSIPQEIKYHNCSINQNYALLRQLSGSPSPYQHINYLIWPETAIADLLPVEQQSINLDYLLPRISAPHTTEYFITGVTRAKARVNKTHNFIETYYNSLIVVNKYGKIIGSYDKKHLVPFGEFIPLRWLLPIESIAAGRSDYEAGKGPIVLSNPPSETELTPFSPLICFDGIFTNDVVVKTGAPRAKWMLNLTNDAWFINTIGAEQHLHTVRLRAIEEGIPLIRASNQGFSVIIDSYGRILASLSPQEVGVIDGPLPEPCASPTIFSRYGNLVTIITAILIAMYALYYDRERAAVAEGRMKS